jgi:hypothetical protein
VRPGEVPRLGVAEPACAHVARRRQRRFDPDLRLKSKSISPVRADTRHVELEHRLLDNRGAAAEPVRATTATGQRWDGLLASYSRTPEAGA